MQFIITATRTSVTNSQGQVRFLGLPQEIEESISNNRPLRLTIEGLGEIDMGDGRCAYVSHNGNAPKLRKILEKIDSSEEQAITFEAMAEFLTTPIVKVKKGKKAPLPVGKKVTF